MPSPHPRSLAGFLAKAKTTLTASKSVRPTPLTLVIGNEAADLDSIVSALLYAYLRSHTPPSYTLHVPLCNIPRADLSLRKDVDAALDPKNTKVSRGDLLSLSDLPADLEARHTRWVLVDHNEMTGELADATKGFRDRVVGCVDHHVDEGIVPADTGNGEPRVIRPCGSAATLVIEFCRDPWDRATAAALGPEDGEEEKDRETVAEQLARLVLGPILADTQCLKSKSKTTDADREVARMAEEVLLRPHPRTVKAKTKTAANTVTAATNAATGKEDNYDREKYFDEMCRLKEDISGFSYRDVWRKDYKEWTDHGGGTGLRLGVSSVPQAFGWLLDNIGPKEELWSETKLWAVERRLDIVSVMTVKQRDEDGGLGRELMVWALNAKAVEVVKMFKEEFEEELMLEGWRGGVLDGGCAVVEDGDGDGEKGKEEWRMCWRQGNEEHSRKQVAPMLREAMKRASSPKL